MGYRIGVDTGGTFTDIVLVNEETGKYQRTKTSTTPRDLSGCFLEGIRKGVGLIGDTKNISSIFHGTTFTTNLILEQKFSNLGLIVTKGFRHILEIARQTVPGDMGDIASWIKPDRIVPLENLEEVTERVNHKGEVLTALDEKEVRSIIQKYKQNGIQAVSVSLLHSYINPAHEIRIRDIFKEIYPECFVSISSEVLPEFREYERTVTTLINSFVVPYIWKYIGGIEEKLKATEIKAHLYIMKSSGGSVTAAEAVRRPIYTALSGPAAGVIGATYIGEHSGYKRIISLDMGGTSTDLCLIENGLPKLTREGRIGIYPLKIPMLDVVSIGAGGGSLAGVAPGKALRVGPRSAGADPGPACYGRGGKNPTITDANLVLGRIPSSLLGGEFKLNEKMAGEAIEGLGKVVGLDPIATAYGILEIAIINMINGVRQVSIRRGRDPRDYTLLAFGGAGPLHAGRVAELLGIKTVVVPPMPGVLASLGLLFTDLINDYVYSLIQRQDQIDLARINDLYARMEKEADRTFQKEGVPLERIKINRSMDLRYAGQAYEVTVEAPSGEFSQAQMNTVIENFHSAHQDIYGYCYRGMQTVEVVNLRVNSLGILDKPLPWEVPCGGEKPEGALKGSRQVFFKKYDGFIDCPILAREKLMANNVILGPAIIEEYDSTTVINPDKIAKVDRLGNLIIS